MMKNLKKIISNTLNDDERVIFAYLYGSTINDETDYNDIDIAVFSRGDADPHILSADLKVELHKRSDLPPEIFDIRIVNDLLETGDIYSLLYLKNVLSVNCTLVDKNEELRTDFIETYARKYRECEGLMQELVE